MVDALSRVMAAKALENNNEDGGSSMYIHKISIYQTGYSETEMPEFDGILYFLSPSPNAITTFDGLKTYLISQNTIFTGQGSGMSNNAVTLDIDGSEEAYVDIMFYPVTGSSDITFLFYGTGVLRGKGFYYISVDPSRKGSGEDEESYAVTVSDIVTSI